MPSPANIDDGSIYQILGLSVGSNADLVPPTDVSQWKWLNLNILDNAYSGELSFFYSYDQVTWDALTMYNVPSLDGTLANNHTFNYNTLYGTPVYFPYFKCTMSGYSSGDALATLILYKDGLAGFQLLTTNAVLNDSLAHIGFTRNDGVHNAVIAAGHAADTVIASQPGALARVLVTATGTNSMLIYDNASTASGNVIGVIPANPTVTGIPFVFKMPTDHGVTVKGDSNNPAVTISYA
jgi:hypothetical protein